MSTPPYKVGDIVSHCDTHGSDRDQSRWRPAMRPCEITSVEGPDKWGGYTYGIRHTDGREGARVAACCWISPDADTRPPYFSRTIKWPHGVAMELGDPARGFFVAFRLDPDSGAYALHSNTAEVPDEVERTFHARRHTLADLAQQLADIAKLRNFHGFDADDFERLIRGGVAANRAEDWVMEWVGLGGVDVKSFQPKQDKEESAPTPEPVKSIGKQVVEAAKDVKKRGRKVVIAEAQAKAGEAPIAPVVATLEEVGAKEHAGVIVAHAETAPVLPTHFRGVLLRPASDWADPSAEGVFVGVSNTDYHADKGSLSSTRIKSLVQSEAHALVPVEISQAARDIGTLVHGFALEGFTTAEQMGFKVVEGKTTTKEGCVTTTMIATAQACVKALRDDANTRALIAREGLSELSVRVRCPDTGLMLRARFDRAPAEGFGCFDIKSTGGTIEQFVASFFEFGYDIGAYHYLRVSDLAGLGYRGMSFPVVCKEAPHEVGLFHFADMPQVADEWDLAAKSHRTACVRELHIRQTGEARKRTHEPVWPNAKPWQVEARRRRLGDAEVPY